MTEEAYIWVRRQWNGTAAKYHRQDFSGPHWSASAGGRGGNQPRHFVFGYVPCDAAVEGEIGHSGSHGPCPHRIKVCVVAKDNPASVVASVTSEAGPRPSPAPSAADRVVEALGRAGGELLNSELWAQALLTKSNGDSVLTRLVKADRIQSFEKVAPNRAGRPQVQKAWRLRD